MSTLIFNNPEHILMVGRMPTSLTQITFEVFTLFYDQLEFFDYFSALEKKKKNLEQYLNSRFDFIAIYDPVNFCVVGFLVSKKLDTWLDKICANKNTLVSLTKFRFEQVFLSHNFCEDIFLQMVPVC